MDNFDRELEDLLNMTDSEDSSDSSNEGVFGRTDHVVLELHDLKKDQPATEAVKKATEAKKKEKRKKKKKYPNTDKDLASDSSSSLSDSIAPLPDEVNKEEFYDAHESYHALSENQQTTPTATLILAQLHSEHIQESKVTPERSTASEPTSATPRKTSTITKPVSNPPP